MHGNEPGALRGNTGINVAATLTIMAYAAFNLRRQRSRLRHGTIYYLRLRARSTFKADYDFWYITLVNATTFSM